jgi:hypothetical protein
VSREVLVSLATFAHMVGRAPGTVRNAITSRDLARRAQWPEFRRAPGGAWVTTTDAIRAWHDAIDPASLSPAVARAIERAKAS